MRLNLARQRMNETKMARKEKATKRKKEWKIP